MTGIPMLLLSAGSIIAVLFFVTYASQKHNLNSIKDKTVGNGQHGTARWATKQEIHRTYHHVPFTPEAWRATAKEGQQPTANGKPLPQGIVLGCQGGKKTSALVDSDDVHVLMIGASGVGKTAYFLYPNLEYACASGMSFLSLDTKGDLARNYGAIARDIYHYRISVVDLREPTRSDGNNLLTLINRYMDEHRENTKEISAKAKAEKYAKILAKTIINPEGSDHGQNAYFYDAAEGLLASVVLLLSEFLPPEETEGYETRHIASVFQLVQELLMQGQMGGNQFQELMQLLPADHKAKWLAGSALTASDQAMNSIMSTVLSKLNGARSHINGLLWPEAGSGKVECVPSIDGNKLLIYTRAAAKYESVGVLDFLRKSYTAFSRENMNDVDERAAYWFDSDSVIIEACSNDNGKDYYIYRIPSE